MPDIAPQKSEVVTDGGFRIEIGTDELTVTADSTAWKARKRSRTSIVLLAIVASALILRLVFSLADDGWATTAVAALILVPIAIWATFERTRNIRCTRQSLEVIDIVRKREVGRATYLREQVQHIEFAPVSFGRYQAVCGLVFKVDGKKIKVLRGIESPEAQIALRELKRLGYDAVIDVGMPMAAEMALERRNSWLGFR